MWWCLLHYIIIGIPSWGLPANARDKRDASSIPGSGRSLGEEMAIHSSILAWRILWTEEPCRLQFMGSQRVGCDWACTHTHTHTHTRISIVHLLLFNCSVMSDYLWPHRLKHARLPCPSPSPRDCLNSYPSSWWCHPTISSSVVPFSSCLQSFPASGSFLMSQLFKSGGQSTRASASASVLPTNIQDGFH